MANPPPRGHIRLILLPDPQLYLEVPLNIICSLCLKPRRYVVYFGWCIIGVEGGLAEHHGGGRMAFDGALDDQGIYYYVTNEHTGKSFLLVVLNAYQALIIPLCSMKISARQSTWRSLRNGRMCIRKLRTPAIISATNLSNVMCVVYLQDCERKVDLGCISFPMRGALRWAQNSIIPLP